MRLARFLRRFFSHLLHLRFSETGGRSVREEIEHVRLERVCELLRRTDDPIDAIGPACGFASDSHLKETFRRRFGCTMGRFRARR